MLWPGRPLDAKQAIRMDGGGAFIGQGLELLPRSLSDRFYHPGASWMRLGLRGLFACREYFKWLQNFDYN